MTNMVRQPVNEKTFVLPAGSVGQVVGACGGGFWGWDWERRVQVAFDEDHSPIGGGHGGGCFQKWKKNVVLSVAAESQVSKRAREGGREGGREGESD